MTDEELWARKATQIAQQVRKLMASDIERHLLKTAREAFIHSSAPSNPEAVATLKDATKAEAQALGRWVAEGLRDEVLLAGDVPQDPGAPLTAHPSVPPFIEILDGKVDAFFKTHGLKPSPEYQLPARFIDGQNLPSLTRELWKALAHTAEARAQRSARQAADAVEAKRRLWDDA